MRARCRIDVRNSCAENMTGDLGQSPGQLHAGGSAPTTTKFKGSVASPATRLAFGQLER